MNILVTGASKGIGKIIALKLKELGYNVYGTARNEEALKASGLTGYFVCDLSKFEALQNLLIQKWI